MTGPLAPWRARLASRRARTQWPILAVALTVALVTGALLAGMSVLVTATEELALRSVLGATPAERTRLEVRTTMSNLRGDVDAVAARSHAAAAEVLGPAPHTTTTHVASTLYLVLREGSTPAMAYAAAMQDVLEHVDLVAGSLPGAPFETDWTDEEGTTQSRTVIPVLAPEPTLEALDLELGDRVELRGTFGLGDRVLVQVTGTFAAHEPHGGFWRADRLSGTGWRPDAVVPGTGGSLTTDLVGPLLLDRTTMTSGLVASEVVHTSYVPDLSGVTARELPLLESRAARAGEDVPRLVTASDVDSVQVTTRLTEPLRSAGTALTITRAAVLVVGLLLAVVAVAALLQAARLVAEGRTAEHSLVRARGASGRQTLTLGAIEAGVLALVVAAASPFLARGLYGLVARTPAMRAAEMDRPTAITGATWLVAAIAAAVFALVLVSPLVRRPGTFVDAEAERARPDRKGFLQRSGLDLAIVALAALAFWQLHQYASPLVRSARGLAVDPLLVAGPALVLLAGALLCARVLPPVSRLAERLAARGRGASAPLAAWEVARRPSRATSAVLLLTLALAVGTFSLTFLSTWRASQAEQAAFAVGADARVTGLTGSAFSKPAALTIPGVASIGSTSRADGKIGATGSRGALLRTTGVTVLGLDAASREQLLDALDGHPSARTLVAALGDSAPDRLPGIELPEGTGALDLEVLLAKTGETMPGLVTTVRLAVQDAAGLIRTFDAGTLPVTGEPQRVVVDLASLAEDEAEAAAETDGPTSARTPREPLRVVAAQTAWFAPPSAELEGWVGEHGGSTFTMTFTVREILALPRVPAEDEQVTGTPVEPGELAWYAKVRDVVPQTVTPEDGDLLHARLQTNGFTIARTPGTATQTTWPATVAVPLVVSQSLAREIDTGSDELALAVGEQVVPVRVVAVTPDVPTVAPGTRAVVADAGALAQALLEQGARLTDELEWWVDLEDDARLAALEAHVTSLGGELDSRHAETLERRDSPLRVGVQAVLWLVVLGASLLAAIGYAVYATVTIRDRALEFAQLRAIGLQRRSLLAVVGRESLLVTSLSAVFGIGLGAALGLLVAPVVSLSPDGTRPVPEVAVVVPWGQVGLLAAEVALALALVVAVVSRTLRSADPAEVMRAGDAR